MYLTVANAEIMERIRGIALVAILCITFLEVYAMSQGVDGISLSLAIGGITGLGGFTAGKIQERISGRSDRNAKTEARRDR